jgi:hypothetical protein
VPQHSAFTKHTALGNPAQERAAVKVQDMQLAAHQDKHIPASFTCRIGTFTFSPVQQLWSMVASQEGNKQSLQACI